MELPQPGEELVSKHGAQYRDGQQEQRMAGGNPPLMIRRQPPARNDRVDIVVAEQVRTPGVQDGEESDLSTEPLRIGCHLEQGLGSSLEQQVEQGPWAGKRQWVQLMGQGKHHVEVVGVEEIALLEFEPSPPRLRLALGTASRAACNGVHSITCRNRHCPKCQGNVRAKWLAARSAELLPVPYFHIVFTLPHELCALILQNKRLLYDLLFRTSAASLLELARDPKHLGVDIGFLGVLHTWGQNLQVNPHS